MFTNMCFVVFILVPYHIILSVISCSISQLCAQIYPCYNVLPGAVFCCFNKNYNVYKIFNNIIVTLFEFKEEEEEEFWCQWETRHFLFNPFPMHEFT